MVERQLPKLHTGVRFPSPADHSSPSEEDLNEHRWTLSDVLTISSDQRWHQSPRTHTSRQRPLSGSPALMALAVTEGFDGSNGARKQPTKNWLRNWPMNGKGSRNWQDRDG